jgi:hypothetical protein
MSTLGDTVRAAAELLALYDAAPDKIKITAGAEWADDLAEAIRDITERGWNA